MRNSVEITRWVELLVCGEELERVDLEERRVEEELDGGGPLLGVLPEALPQEVPLLLVLQLVDGGSDLLFRYGTFEVHGKL